MIEIAKPYAHTDTRNCKYDREWRATFMIEYGCKR